MEHRFQYHVPFTDQTQYRARARAREHYNRFARTHPLLIHVHLVMYIITHIYIEDMCTKKVSECAVTFERSVLVKIANSNFVPTLCGFRWYPLFCGSGTVSGIRGKQMTPAVASERSVSFSKNHDYNV